ncbi:MAG: ABC transporter substrate-binding protein, partial [Patescibacteria group bacterium]|nr:ABC transporter substrate-binding protein [Patescibacteria group bacterium]
MSPLASLLTAMVLSQAISVELPLYEQEPFDRITLNAANEGAVLEVEPLDLPQRRVPEKPKPGDKLRIRLLSRPGVEYELPWQAIENVELFEQMVLAEAELLVKEGKLEEAYDYYAFLERHHADLPGLAEAADTYLYEEAKAAHRAGLFDRALAMLRENYRRNPKREGLDKALGVATSRRIDEYVAQHDYAAVRELVRSLADCYPDHEVASQWTTRLTGQAESLLTEARKAVAEHRFRDASRLCRELAAVWPDLPGARELAEEVHRQYPRVVVAVASLPGHVEPASLVDWHARRAARLRYRALLELVGPGTEGGRYVCPLGTMKTESLGRQMVFELQPGIGWAGREETLTGYDVSRQLLWPRDRADAAAIDAGGWPSAHAALVAGARVADVYRLEVTLRQVALRPERAFQTIVPPISWPGPPEPLPANGPYQPAGQEPDSMAFIANDGYFARQAGQPAEIVERRLEPAQAVALLRSGAVDLIDRVAPWTLPEVQDQAVRNNAVVSIQPYAFPMVHCLIPSPNAGLVSRRTFRRALVYGLDRQRILARLLADRESPGCEVADGPFARGYARDPEVAPRPFDPRLAI